MLTKEQIELHVSEGTLQFIGTDLARTALAALARAEDAEAAVALVVEQAADSLLEASVWCDSQERTDASWHNGVVDARKHHMAAIRHLASASAVAKLAELRAERDGAVSTLAYCEKQWSESDRVTHAKMLGERARADSLTTENQRLQDRERVLKRERDEAVMFLDNAVSKAPEPLRELGGWLANKLDEDEWPTAERFLNAAAKSLADLAADPEIRAAIKEKIKTDPSMMRELLARTEGKVPDILQIETPAPLVIDLVGKDE